MNAVFIIGIFLSFFLSFLLVSKKQKRLPDIILAIWLVIIAVHLANYFLYSLDYWSKHPHLIGVTAPIPLLHGPMLYLYTLHSLRQDRSLRRKDYLHFLPAVATWIYMIPFYFFYSTEEKVLVDTGQVEDFAVFYIILFIAFILSGLTYPILAFKRLIAHKQLVEDNFSNDSRISLEWLKYWIYAIGLLYLTVAAISMLQDGLGVEFPFNTDYIVYILLVLFVICMGFFGIRHQDVFIADSLHGSVPLVQSKSPVEYRKSGLKLEVAENIHEKLQSVMLTMKPYLNSKLTLNDLASDMDVSPNHLSQIINQYENVNFHDFVNRYRVEAFIQKAAANQVYSILAHAYDAGFNSKSTFNSVFKKLKGSTPSRYMSDLPNSTK
ncbi:MAG: helix-turn-helix transcriptional regulator [Candidatus Marinimicrobia bacterium]|jgi:AraC-like DNA-binding protein|nr:helix-turn-helix transcriptional regulator [Candidatus Neomarinimicrobiota bacterium]MBT4361656.1 helix-turn-helix transcriptional regulator [Candidatus Neomarinimicrobiota bacterium]MBT4713980.1 helix-turn-helix transcriptional regulator [Candidatus Neomarinimicrobiota bacterium]MBT4947064.1 helix-turn-helix transcriptional regulator [Candidatus Neomarinimicrobiota bacterium]MBT5268438.1 helix-turn-helix transcriptional regulator [Candidatus Neomarinimicrobiota bacterium]